MSDSHHKITFGPYWANILEYIGNDNLATPDGTPVTIRQVITTFYIEIGTWTHAMPDNLTASALLNNHRVGIITRYSS